MITNRIFKFLWDKTFYFILSVIIMINILIIYASINFYLFSGSPNLSKDIDFLILFLIIMDLIIFPHFYIIDKIGNLFKDPIKYDKFKKFSIEKSITIVVIKYTPHSFYISLSIFILSIIGYLILNNSLFDPFSFSFSMLNEQNLHNIASFVLQIIITLSFFWFYMVLILMLIPKNEFFYYNITRAYIFSIDRTQDNYEKSKYLVLALGYYQKFIQQNLHLKIKAIECLYDNILTSSNSDLFFNLSKSFKDNSNKLLPFEEIIKFLKKKENESVTEIISRNIKLSFEIIISSIIPILILILEKLYP